VITQAEARVYLPGISADDSNVAELITRADAILAAWCGYEAATETGAPTFEDVSCTRYLPGPGGRDLWLPVWPVASVTSIYDDPDEAYGASTLVDSGDYDIRDKGRIRLAVDAVHGTWTEDDDGLPIKVVWVAGWATIPSAIKQAVAEYVAVLWRLRAGPGVTSNTSQKGTTNIPTGEIPKSIQQRLAPYRLISDAGGGT
jgi:hypothetical protein